MALAFIHALQTVNILHTDAAIQSHLHQPVQIHVQLSTSTAILTETPSCSQNYTNEQTLSTFSRTTDTLTAVLLLGSE